MNKRLLYPVVAVNVALGVLLLYFIFRTESPKIYAVDYELVFQKFDMTKEIKKEGDRLIDLRENKLDSLNRALQLDVSGDRNSQIMAQILRERDSLEMFKQQYVNESSNKIWKRITSYSADFAKIKGCELIINSSQSSGAVIYSSSTQSFTDEFVNFLNQRYAGTK